MTIGQNIPELANNETNSGGIEKLKQSMYDTVIYPAAGTTELQLFALGYGQGKSAQPGWATKSKTKADTNMKKNGAMGSNEAYLAESLEIYFLAGSDATADTFVLASPIAWNATAAATLTTGVDDLHSFYASGLVEFKVGDKTVCMESPIGRFPPKTFRDGSFAVASNSATTAEAVIGLARASGRPYFFTPPVPLDENVSFSLTLTWPAVVATPSTKNGQVKAVLDGFLYRKA